MYCQKQLSISLSNVKTADRKFEKLFPYLVIDLSCQYIHGQSRRVVRLWSFGLFSALFLCTRGASDQRFSLFAFPRIFLLCVSGCCGSSVFLRVLFHVSGRCEIPEHPSIYVFCRVCPAVAGFLSIRLSVIRPRVSPSVINSYY